MADNVTLPGTGISVAADDVSGALYQRVKIAVGADGAAADLAPGQAAMAASLPVVIASDQAAVPVSDGGGSLTVDGTVTVAGAAADDAAAAGNPVPIGCVYHAAPDAVDDGDVGRLRMTERRALLVAPDLQINQVAVNNVAAPGGIQCLTGDYSAQTWVDPAGTFFDGTHGDFDAAPRYVRIPMTGFTQVVVSLYHSLGVNLTIDLYPMWQGYTGGDGILAAELASVVAATATTVVFSPQAGGSGAGALLYPVPALQMPMKWLLLELTPASDPSAGYIVINVARS